MVAVLICLALLLGVLFGGSATWFLKPDSESRVIEKQINKYVCYDGTVKTVQSDCPIVSTDEGQTQVVCPPCDTSGYVYTKCACTQCRAECGIECAPAGGRVTTTTIYVPKCKPCTTDMECGTSSYENLTRCDDNKAYKNLINPVCDDSCCKQTQSIEVIETCTSDQTCMRGQGCVERED